MFGRAKKVEVDKTVLDSLAAQIAVILSNGDVEAEKAMGILAQGYAQFRKHYKKACSKMGCFMFESDYPTEAPLVFVYWLTGAFEYFDKRCKTFGAAADGENVEVLHGLKQAIDNLGYSLDISVLEDQVEEEAAFSKETAVLISDLFREKGYELIVFVVPEVDNSAGGGHSCCGCCSAASAVDVEDEDAADEDNEDAADNDNEEDSDDEEEEDISNDDDEDEGKEVYLFVVPTDKIEKLQQLGVKLGFLFHTVEEADAWKD